jgi:hypothetical protein
MQAAGKALLGLRPDVLREDIVIGSIRLRRASARLYDAKVALIETFG